MSALASLLVSHLQVTALFARLDLDFKDSIVRNFLLWIDRIFNIAQVENLLRDVSFVPDAPPQFDLLVDNAALSGIVPAALALAFIFFNTRIKFFVITFLFVVGVAFIVMCAMTIKIQDWASDSKSHLIFNQTSKSVQTISASSVPDSVLTKLSVASGLGTISLILVFVLLFLWKDAVRYLKNYFVGGNPLGGCCGNSEGGGGGGTRDGALELHRARILSAAAAAAEPSSQRVGVQWLVVVLLTSVGGVLAFVVAPRMSSSAAATVKLVGTFVFAIGLLFVFLLIVKNIPVCARIFKWCGFTIRSSFTVMYVLLVSIVYLPILNRLLMIATCKHASVSLSSSSSSSSNLTTTTTSPSTNSSSSSSSTPTAIVSVWRTAPQMLCSSELVRSTRIVALVCSIILSLSFPYFLHRTLRRCVEVSRLLLCSLRPPFWSNMPDIPEDFEYDAEKIGKRSREKLWAIHLNSKASSRVAALSFLSEYCLESYGFVSLDMVRRACVLFVVSVVSNHLGTRVAAAVLLILHSVTLIVVVAKVPIFISQLLNVILIWLSACNVFNAIVVVVVASGGSVSSLVEILLVAVNVAAPCLLILGKLYVSISEALSSCCCTGEQTAVVGGYLTSLTGGKADEAAASMAAFDSRELPSLKQSVNSLLRSVSKDLQELKEEQQREQQGSDDDDDDDNQRRSVGDPMNNNHPSEASLLNANRAATAAAGGYDGSEGGIDRRGAGTVFIAGDGHSASMQETPEEQDLRKSRLIAQGSGRALVNDYMNVVASVELTRTALVIASTGLSLSLAVIAAISVLSYL